MCLLKVKELKEELKRAMAGTKLVAGPSVDSQKTVDSLKAELLQKTQVRE